jgi:hypothetical protein
VIPLAMAFGPTSDTALSAEARTLREDRVRGLLSSPSVGAQDRASILDRIQQVASEASVNNWDGDGGAAVEQSTLRYAWRFAYSLPQGTPAPDVVVDRDGDIVFDWAAHPHSVFSVSVGRDGTMTFAGLFGAAKQHGREPLSESIPATILVGIERAIQS